MGKIYYLVQLLCSKYALKLPKCFNHFQNRVLPIKWVRNYPSGILGDLKIAEFLGEQENIV
jgi:hypothetical protein